MLLKIWVFLVTVPACGIKPTVNKTKAPESAEIKFIFNDADLEELEAAKREKKIYRISNLELDNLGNAIDSSSRVGYYIFQGDKQ